MKHNRNHTMMNFGFLSALIGILMINSVTGECRPGPVEWNGKNWAVSCDFRGKDLSNVRITSKLCDRNCVKMPGCTHFVWTRQNGGTCWMKNGPVSKHDACKTNDPSMICGVTEIGKSKPSGKSLSKVHTTHHGAHEPGACELPALNYAVQHALALGDIEVLKHLKWRHGLCGHVLRIDCGNGPLDVLVTNVNRGGGLDLYASTWNRLTKNQSPGIAHCSVQLSSRNPFNFHGPRCFYIPNSRPSEQYYRNVGLFNTNGRIIRSATIDNRHGQHRGDNSYFAFDFGGQIISTDKQVVFTFEDGTTHRVHLRDCKYSNGKQSWQ